MELQRLDREETRELVAALTGSDAVDVDAWYEQTQGNPYLLGELVKDPGSRRVKDVLLSRVRSLGPDAAELVGLAAIFGLWVPDQQLCRASELRARPLRRPPSARPSTPACWSSRAPTTPSGTA